MTNPRMPRQTLPDSYEVKIILDSVNQTGNRLTTWALTYPRFIHSELMTYRVFSRNAASSRAIPTEKMRKLIREHPALPVFWGKNQAGMQAKEELSNEPIDLFHGGQARSGSTKSEAQRLWLEARDLMLEYSAKLAELGLHKQLCNRITEAWMPITVLVSGTTFENLFLQRDHPDAQPEFQAVVTEMRYQYLEAQPTKLLTGMWHMPFIRAEDQFEALDRFGRENEAAHLALKKISVGRCARVSYLTHEGTRDLMEDIKLHDKLVSTTENQEPGHFSPFEHVARALDTPAQVGNFRGWYQYRKEFPNESGELA